MSWSSFLYPPLPGYVMAKYMNSPLNAILMSSTFFGKTLKLKRTHRSYAECFYLLKYLHLHYDKTISDKKSLIVNYTDPWSRQITKPAWQIDRFVKDPVWKWPCYLSISQNKKWPTIKPNYKLIMGILVIWNWNIDQGWSRKNVIVIVRFFFFNK